MPNEPKKPLFGELNSAEFSQEPESLEPENLNGLDLIIKNNHEATKPKVIKKIVGPFKGFAFKGQTDDLFIEKGDGDFSFLSFTSANKFYKHRVYIPELHSHLPDIGNDPENVPMSIATMYPEFIAQSSNVPEAKRGTLVWCDFLDRENFKDPVYLGPVDDKAAQPNGTNNPGGTATAGGALAGSSAAGDPFGGKSYKNAAGQVSYPQMSGSWTGELPKDGFTATNATVEQLVILAKAQLGIKEEPMGSNGGPKVDEFNGGRKEAWCAASMAWLFRQIGAPLPGDRIPNSSATGWNGNHSVTVIQDNFTKLNSFFKEPMTGDMILYNTDGDPDLVNSHKHIGLVVEASGDIIKTIEFNWGDQVAQTHQDWRNGFMIKSDGSKYKSKYVILGFARRPLPYSGVPGGQLVEAPVDRIVGSGGPPGANHPFYKIAERGKIIDTPVEMVYIEGTKRLYPKKYIRALDAMRNAYKSETGKTLTIVSAYRDVDQQATLYNAYLARNKAPPQVAPPGFSLHNNGVAIDIEMSADRIDYSGKYTTFTFNNSVNKQDVHSRASRGEFGPVSQWLVNNCGRFGFYWDGWSYRELWHYQLNVDAARQAGLIDS